MKRARPEAILVSAYQSLFSTKAAGTVLTDLVEFAQQEKDPQVRAGRMDMIARILRQRGKSIPDTAPSVFDQEE